MDFEGMKNEYEQWQRGEKDRAENKQRLNVSDHAYQVLQNDMTVFLPQSAQKDSGRIPSGFVNRIFRNFRGTAGSSIACRVADREFHYESLLAEIRTGEKKKALSALTGDYEANLIREVERRLAEKGNSFSFRIDRDNIQYLASEEGQAEKDYYKNNITLYIKAVIEEYAEVPYAERERIYFKENIDKINMAVSHRKVLKIILRNDNTKYMKVLGLYKDREYLYNYVVGVMSDDRKKTWKPGAIRLTSIFDCDRLEQPAFISKESRELIVSIMKRQGVQYLSSGDTSYRVVVEFTPEGEKMYQKILHLRPLYTNKGADRIYEFNCSKLQAESYFFRFGREVKILEPVSLAEEFLAGYRAAAEQY